MNPSKLIPLASVLLFVASANFSTAQILIQDRGVEKSLDQQVDMNFDEVAFSVMCKTIKSRFGVTLGVSHGALDIGLTENDIVSYKASGVLLRHALTDFLDKFDCNFVTYRNAVHIMTNEECEQTMQIKSYDCRKLVKAFRPKTVDTVYYNGKRIDASKESVNSKMLVSLARDKQERETDSANRNAEPAHYLVHHRELTAGQHLAEVIKQLTPADSWKEGGGKGTITVVNGWLMIRQNGIVHHDIPKVLDLLEKDLSAEQER